MSYRIDERTEGVWVIAPTPFTDTGALDLDGIPRLVDFFAGHGAHGLTVLGMMGEASKLTAEEQVQVGDAFLRAAGDKLPIIVGASASALTAVTGLTRHVMDRGAAGVMVAPTPGLKTDDQVWGYVDAVVRGVGNGVPLVFQDYPQSTGVTLATSLWTRIVRDFPSIVMLKHEDCPGLAKISRIRADEAAGQRRVSMLIGNGGLYYVEELERGADGAMTGFAFPEMLVEVWKLSKAGEREAARDLFDAFLPVIRYEQQPGYGLVVRKETLRRRGALGSAFARYPAASLGREGQAELDTLLRRLADRLASEKPEWAARVAA